MLDKKMKALTNPLVNTAIFTTVASIVWACLSYALGDYRIAKHVGFTAIIGGIYYLTTRFRRS